MDNKDKGTGRFNQEALALFFELSGWIAIPVIIGLFAGKWLDAKFQTKPFLMLICIGIAFITTIAGLIRRGRRMMKDASKDEDKENPKH